MIFKDYPHYFWLFMNILIINAVWSMAIFGVTEGIWRALVNEVVNIEDIRYWF